MRTALLITVDKAGKTTLVCGTEVSVQKQKETFRKLEAETRDGNDKIVKLQLWESGRGLIKRKNYLTGAEVESTKSAIARQAKLEQDNARKLAEKLEAEKIEQLKKKEAEWSKNSPGADPKSNPFTAELKQLEKSTPAKKNETA